MHEHTPACENGVQPRCCPAHAGVDRRTFLGAAAFGGTVLSGLSWSALQAAEPELPAAPARRPLKVKPILIYATYTKQPQTSWRPWGGIEKPEDAQAEIGRIQTELQQLPAGADFPMEILPLSAVRSVTELASAGDVAAADVLLVYPATGDGGVFRFLAEAGKDVIFFIRHNSGPVSLYYEIISPRFLRQHTDTLAVKGIDDDDVVVDRYDEVLWRLRALCGLRNTLGSKILCIGGPSAWAQPEGVVPKLVQEKFKLDLVTISYEELGKLIEAAGADAATMKLAAGRAEAYLQDPAVKLETEKEYVTRCMLLDQVFRNLMREAGCRSITINACMGTIMKVANTTACMTLSTLNDDGYQAFCESDFVVVPSGMLLGNITGKPAFMNDPTYPHDGIITLAHCTAPRKMDGKAMEPVRIRTHFESDFGAAPQVQMHPGQAITNIIPDFKFERWVGIKGEIAAFTDYPICRSQINIRFTCDSKRVAERMPGFHWMTGYGDYTRELGYALKRIPIQWELLG